jgi:hypothetical protein
MIGHGVKFFLPQILFFCDLKSHEKFQNNEQTITMGADASSQTQRKIKKIKV